MMEGRLRVERGEASSWRGLIQRVIGSSIRYQVLHVKFRKIEINIV